MTIDASLLLEFIERFDQYGNRRAPFWIIGPEEGGVETLDEFKIRLNAWNQLGRPTVVDIAQFHQSIGEHKWFRKDGPTQSTWRPLIYLLLAAMGIEANLQNARHYQVNSLGRDAGDTWITELLPLPAKSESSWIYNQLSDNPKLHFLADRKSYKEYCAIKKVKRIKNLLESHPPKVVVFYGRNDVYWNEIAGGFLDSKLQSGATYDVQDHTIFVNTSHPNKRGIDNEYWISTGTELHRLLR